MIINSKTINTANWLIREAKKRFSEDAYIYADDADSEISVVVPYRLYWQDDFRKFIGEIYDTKEVYGIRFISLPEDMFCQIKEASENP